VPLEPVPGPLRPLIEAGMAKDPGRRPADATILVAELRTVAAGAYGPDWEDRGRSRLGEAALLLAALWPSGGAPVVQGAAVHRISLRRHIRLRHLSPVKAAIAAGVAVTVVAVVVVAQTRSAGPVATHTRPAGSAAAGFTVSGGLGGVAAASADSVWAVGGTGRPGGGSTSASGRTLILRWNGHGLDAGAQPGPGNIP
jgi:eukaryotic-like serine/threonine-protein kinase